jgi:hypothetical protein
MDRRIITCVLLLLSSIGIIAQEIQLEAEGAIKIE